MRKNVIYFLLFVPMLLFAQTKTVTGKVTAASDGAPLPGVNVIVKGTTNGTQTDFDGNYSIKVAENAVLQFSYVGFKTKEKKVVGGGNSLTFNILLKDDTEALEEVVVVGYGTQKKANLTGSVSTVKADNIANKPVTSLANALQGVTPGVTIISRPGDVGGGKGTINVRGRGNLGSSSPLYVVDGVPVGGDDFQNINPADIESISILKDAAASSIYGSRAAYGVFLVTTKKGNKGELKVQLNSYYGLQTPTFLPQKVNAYQYATLKNKANINAGKKPVYDKATLKIIKDGSQPDLYPDNDWYDLVYRDSAPIQEHSISLSGGGKTKYYVSGSFFDQESLIKGKDFNRYSFRANTERKFSDIFTLGTNVSFVQESFERTVADFDRRHLYRMTPLTVAKHSDGTWGSIESGGVSAELASNNPLREMAEGGRGHFNSKTLIASIKGNLKPMEGLDITGMLSYKGWNKEDSSFKNTVEPIIDFKTKKPIASTAILTNEMKETWKTDHTLTAQTYASYQKDFGLHYAKIMVGLQYEDYQYKYLYARRINFPSNSLDAINAGEEKEAKNGGNTSEYAFFSQFGRLNYNYDGKYLLEANVRFDQSSKFHKDSRLGVFPSFSAAWRVTKEHFMEDVKWLNNLKLRASWGELGNVNNVGYYDFYDAMALGTATILGDEKVAGLWPSKLANPSLSWETVVMTNLGLDASLLDNRLTVQVDVFDKLTKDILLVLPQPKELGLGGNEQVSSNAGKVSNKGIEVSLGYNDAIGEDFTYYISGNVSKIWNEIIDLKGADDQINGNWINKVGESIGSFYMYEADGLFKDQADVDAHAKQHTATKPGDIKYKDINGDGKINGDDRKIVGNDVPYFTYGMELGATYKGFDFRVQGQGVGNVKVYLSGEASQAFFNGAGAKTYHLNHWTKENPDPNAAYPRILESGDNGHNRSLSSFWLYDASYFRIKNMSLGYTIPKYVTEKYGIDKLRVYTSGTNIFTTRSDKRLKDFDPEMKSDRGSYPMMKVFSLGVNVTF
ncbi:MAG: TonB-dependent receptor [Flavobacteriaceae bacterium]|nr:TonB-dependent receptor [Flavobacteriaceae bacterium]